MSTACACSRQRSRSPLPKAEAVLPVSSESREPRLRRSCFLAVWVEPPAPILQRRLPLPFPEITKRRLPRTCLRWMRWRCRESSQSGASRAAADAGEAAPSFRAARGCRDGLRHARAAAMGTAAPLWPVARPRSLYGRAEFGVAPERASFSCTSRQAKEKFGVRSRRARRAVARTPPDTQTRAARALGGASKK